MFVPIFPDSSSRIARDTCLIKIIILTKKKKKNRNGEKSLINYNEKVFYNTRTFSYLIFAFYCFVERKYANNFKILNYISILIKLYPILLKVFDFCRSVEVKYSNTHGTYIRMYNVWICKRARRVETNFLIFLVVPRLTRER